MHVHISAMGAILTFLSIIPIAFVWRLIAMKLHNSPLGQAMAFIF